MFVIELDSPQHTYSYINIPVYTGWQSTKIIKCKWEENLQN